METNTATTRRVSAPADITDDIVDATIANLREDLAGRIDWERTLDRLHGYLLDDGTRVDLNDLTDWDHPAIARLKRAVRKARQS